ncbi:hypothetical protein, partial [Stecheria intestinalis]|uniref:hypothetical protein n=1 Tax=Stecheria intestinalis TaxID=2606630 RepID=UPI00197E13BA
PVVNTQIAVETVNIFAQSPAMTKNEIVEQVTQRHLAIFSGKRGLDNSCSLKQGWIMNDGSESLKDITEAHKILYY